jgi:hypothetical protein
VVGDFEPRKKAWTISSRQKTTRERERFGLQRITD